MKSLTLTFGGNEATGKDGVSDDLAVGLRIAKVETILQQSGEIAVEAPIDVDDRVRLQRVEDSTTGSQAEEMPANEASAVLLSVSGSLNGFAIKFLIDSGASECFVGTTFAEQNGFTLTKIKEN